jgi:tol-pal system protein YbgF
MFRSALRYFAALPACLLLVCVTLPALADPPQKDQKEKIDRMAAQLEELKTELTLMQRQVQSMQDALNKTSGEMNALITQIGDNVSAIRRAQSAVSTSSNDAASQISVMGERLTATDQRMERLSEQFAQLKKLIEDIPKAPTFAQITPGNAEQLFAAAYSDYSRGNYDLALSEFRQYVETYPSSELADNAQYWIGEILYAQKKLPEAAAEFDRVSAVNPKGDKAVAALYKKALVLIEMGQKEEAAVQLQALIKNHPKSAEAGLAAQQLPQLPAPPEPAPAESKSTPARKRKP